MGGVGEVELPTALLVAPAGAAAPPAATPPAAAPPAAALDPALERWAAAVALLAEMGLVRGGGDVASPAAAAALLDVAHGDVDRVAALLLDGGGAAV